METKRVVLVVSAVVAGAAVAAIGVRAFGASFGPAINPRNWTDPLVPAALRDDYLARYIACVVLPTKVRQVDALIDRIYGNKARYEGITQLTGVPWWMVGTIHSLEAGLSFGGHLYNGDSLAGRTTGDPPGQPTTGTPPFTWEESAVGALAYDGLTRWHDWDLVGSLYKLEAFNGMGYRNISPSIPSPYLWSFSNQYAAGKFTSDRHYDPSAVSEQCGGGTLWKRMQERGLLSWA